MILSYLFPVRYFKSFLSFLPALTVRSKDNPKPPRVLVAPTDGSVKVPFVVSLFAKTPLIEPLVASLNAVVERCQDIDSGLCATGTSDPAGHSMETHVRDIMSFFCCLISTEWQSPCTKSATEKDKRKD